MKYYIPKFYYEMWNFMGRGKGMKSNWLELKELKINGN